MSGVVFALCLLATGTLLSEAAIRPRDAVERVAYALLFALTALPYALIATVLAASVRLSAPLLHGVSLPATALAVALWWRSRRRDAEPRKTAPRPREWTTLAVAAAVGLGAWVHYTDTEFLLSLASYVDRGEAKCFYMQTFQLLDGLNPGRPFAPMRDLFDVISTPGNTVFTAPFVQAFGVYGPRLVYAAVQVLTFLFVLLVARAWTGRPWLAIAGGLLAVAAPPALSIEVLDRNAIAFALTAAAFHAVETRPERSLVHGWLFGVTAGVGLRFLPLLNLVFVVGAYRAHRANAWRWLGFGLAAAITFAPNLPHLAFHGFHSLGETLPPWTLAARAVTEGYRAPLQALAPGLQVALQSVGHLGAAGTALVFLGAARGWRSRRRETLSLLLVSGAVWAVVACQRDWIEGDKARIALSAWLPVPLLAVLALDRLARPGGRLRALLLLCAALAATFALAHVLRSVEAPADPSSSFRKPIYQSDTPAFAAFYRAHAWPVGLLPGYAALGDKLDLARKRRLEQVTAASLAPLVADKPSPDATWARRAFDVPPPAARPRACADGQSVSLQVDLDRLVTSPGRAVAPAPVGATPFVDLCDPEHLLDVHAREARVSWQPQALPLVVFPLRPEQTADGELVVHLNAYAPLGLDAEGFARVNAIHYVRDAVARVAGLRTALRALPHANADEPLVLRMPRGTRVVLVYWVIDLAKGTPHRVDSWVLEPEDDGTAAVRFRAGEPESYL